MLHITQSLDVGIIESLKAAMVAKQLASYFMGSAAALHTLRNDVRADYKRGMEHNWPLAFLPLHSAYNTSHLQSGPFERPAEVFYIFIAVFKLLASIDIAGRRKLRLVC